MADKTKIEWADATLNYVNGCSVVSPGCTSCYAMKQAHRFPVRQGLTVKTKGGMVWTGEVRENLRALEQALAWKRGRAIFWNAHGDLFHPSVPDEWIDRQFAAMALTPQHRHMILTKRSARMREYCNDPDTPFRIARAMAVLTGQPDGSEELRPIGGFPGYFVSSHGHVYSERRGARKRLRPDVGEQGHLRVPLFRDGGPRRGYRTLVHRLVLEAFDGPAPSLDAQGRHLDGDPGNNSIGNLTWGGQSANWDDSKRHGSFRRYSKLTEEQVAEIRARGAKGEAAYSIAKDFPVSDTQVRNILKGQQWAVEAPIEWPLRNVWKGVSVEDQQRADERIPDLLATPAAVRFISAEPLLGPVNIQRWLNIMWRCSYCRDFFAGRHSQHCPGCGKEGGLCGSHPFNGRNRPDRPGFPYQSGSGLDWVIAGGESGPGARPMHPDWARSLRDQCAAAGVAFHFKQWGEWAPGESFGLGSDGPVTDRRGNVRDWMNRYVVCEDRADRLRGHSFTEHATDLVYRVGKKRAGRLLDGVEHNGVPA